MKFEDIKETIDEIRMWLNVNDTNDVSNMIDLVIDLLHDYEEYLHREAPHAKVSINRCDEARWVLREIQMYVEDMEDFD